MSKKKRFLGYWRSGVGHVVVDRQYDPDYGDLHIAVPARFFESDGDALAYVKAVADALNAAEIPKA